MSRKVRGDGIVGTLYLESGIPGLPGLTFHSDSNTGMYSIGNNIIGFSTNSTNRVVIDAEGDVGIGTNGASPPYRLTVKDSNHQIALQDTESDKIWTLTSINNSGVGIYEDGSAARLTVDAGGNVKAGGKSVVTSNNATELQIVMYSGAFGLSLSGGGTNDGNISWGNVGFVSPPSVSYAGVTPGGSGMGGVAHFNILPYDFTTTGCKIRFTNTSSSSQSFSGVTFHFQVVGAR